MAEEASQPPAAVDAAVDKKAQPQFKVDTSQLKSAYCNVANVTSTREEFVVNFGINQNWDLGHKEMDVELLHRVILSPYAAKRLHVLLNRLLQEYESRYGALS